MPLLLSLSSVVVVAPNQVSCDLDGEAVILSLANGLYYGLDQVGTSIWNRLQTECTVREIRDAIVDQYHVDADRCECDLLRLLHELCEHGLVEVSEARVAM